LIAHENSHERIKQNKKVSYNIVDTPKRDYQYDTVNSRNQGYSESSKLEFAKDNET